MRPPIQISKRHHNNLLSAVNVMWPSVPQINVSRGLLQVASVETSASSVLDFGSWCGRWPAFIKQGVEIDPVTGQVWVARSTTVGTSNRVMVSRYLFGGGGMLAHRGTFITDAHFPDASDHEIITQRLKWMLRNTVITSRLS